MIYGIGIDLVKVERVRQVVERWGGKFLEKVYSADEVAYCYRRKDPYLSLAVRFAAKEALIKAVGAPVSMRDIEVVSGPGGGKPALKAGGKLKAFLDNLNISSAHLSLSHEKDYGLACVVLERDV
jgi:holo-[acyl-carrier protein] synthase